MVAASDDVLDPTTILPSPVGSTSKLGMLLVERLVVLPSAVAPPPVVVRRGVVPLPLPEAKNEPVDRPVAVPPLPPPPPVPVAVKRTVMSALEESQP